MPLGVLVVLGAVVILGSPPQLGATGLWSVGLATGAAVVTPARWRWAVVLVAGALAALVVAIGPRSDDLVPGYAIAIAAEVWVSARVLARRDGRRPELRTDEDLRRYFAAALAGAAVGASLCALTNLVADDGHPERVALSIALAHLASQLFLVPFFLRLPTPGAIAGAVERSAQWVVLVGGTPLLLLPETSPSLAFLVIPILAWGALRTTPLEALAQLVGVLYVAILVTSYDAGPFADVPVRYDLPPDARGIVLSAFCAACAVIVVPLVLRVGEYVGAVRASEAERDLVRGIVDGASGVAIIGTDPIGTITLFNPGAERLLGHTAADVVGRNSVVLHSRQAVTDKAAELGVPDDFAAVTAAMVERRLVGTPVRFVRGDGVERTHAMTLTRLTVGAETVGYVSTSEDITDALDTEQALREALEVERRAVERLQEVDRVKDRFVSTVSHELRTPITSILGYLELLADGTLGPLAPGQVDALVRVQGNSQRLLSLIDDLLTLSKVAERGIERPDRVFDLRTAVRTAYDVVAPSWSSPRRLEVALRLPDAPVEVRGDRAMVERVVVNLLGNAVKFTDDGGSVEVCLDADGRGEHAVLGVVDTGIGIPEEEQGRLFTRFFRSSTAEQRAIPGSGLGLSIAQAVVEQHGGTIRMTSRPGAGTSVEVRLPVAAGNVQHSTTVPA